MDFVLESKEACTFSISAWLASNEPLSASNELAAFDLAVKDPEGIQTWPNKDFSVFMGAGIFLKGGRGRRQQTQVGLSPRDVGGFLPSEEISPPTPEGGKSKREEYPIPASAGRRRKERRTDRPCVMAKENFW